MTDYLLTAKEFYWAHRDVVRAVAAIATIALVNSFLLIWTARRLQELSLLGERVSRLADGVALLADTTEAGLSSLIREVEQLGHRKSATRPSTRASVARRVTAAAESGDTLTAIAVTEGLSESEVRLHLSMAQTAGTETPAA